MWGARACERTKRAGRMEGGRNDGTDGTDGGRDERTADGRTADGRQMDGMNGWDGQTDGRRTGRTGMQNNTWTQPVVSYLAPTGKATNNHRPSQRRDIYDVHIHMHTDMCLYT